MKIFKGFGILDWHKQSEFKKIDGKKITITSCMRSDGADAYCGYVGTVECLPCGGICLHGESSLLVIPSQYINRLKYSLAF